VLLLHAEARSVPSDNPALAQVKELIFASSKLTQKIIDRQFFNDKRINLNVYAFLKVCFNV
jgi:hypothetical protein